MRCPEEVPTREELVWSMHKFAGALDHSGCEDMGCVVRDAIEMIEGMDLPDAA